MISTKIRLVKEDDCISLLEIYGPYITNTSITFEYDIPTIDEFKKRIHSISEKFPWLVCEINGKVVGYAYASRHRERAAYQWSVDVTVYVEPEYHRNHIAKALYTALINTLRVQGYMNAYAGIALPNEKSKCFHENFGFVSVGIYHKVGYKFGTWHDVGWFELVISNHILEPVSPKPISEICETKEFNDILDSVKELIMNNNFKVTLGEVDIAIDILREVAQWCEDNGMNMWKLSDLTKERLMSGLEEKNFCVGRLGEENVCSMILQWSDPLFWPEAKENEAGYIHKLSVRRKYSGANLSKMIVQYAIDECRKRKVRYLRLDTGWNREPLCKLYESLGFKRVGKRILGEREYALYELEVD